MELYLNSKGIEGVLQSPEWHQVVLRELEGLNDTVSRLTSNEERLIIFAATLANTVGESEDMEVIDGIARTYPVILHLDACRVFDHLATAADELHREPNLHRLRLHYSQVEVPGYIIDGGIFATTIVARGSNAYVSPPPMVVLKPKLLGNQSSATVEYSVYVDRVLDIANAAILSVPGCQTIRDELGLRIISQLQSRFTYSTISFVAVDEQNTPLVVFLAEADSKRLIRPSLMLVERSSYEDVHMLQDVAMQLFGHVAQLMDVGIETSWWR
ncbi:hypothetical protein N7457_006383 [Penicillium paradoxum]|uniref:uncharacterized protein n=1 Tax=Penicillium paradoxum TaxID=176176 RepID=UPI002547795B|nr:uncharacterized protein N7457_006383 [Penicillium paradoxum]KAJ5781223.1 hypothetical protein N7457_006383 [Penicillium paradoxum]